MKAFTENPLLIDVPMPIVTPRLLLRPMQKGDGVLLSEAVKETWEDLSTWLTWAVDIDNHTPEAQEKRVQQVTAELALRTNIALVAVTKDTNELAVGTGLHRFNWRTRSFEIGYWCRKKFHGQGYTTEVTNALLRYAFGALNAQNVTIYHADGNEASRRVIEKCGFTLEHIRKNGAEIPGKKLVDDYAYIRYNLDGLPPLELSWGSA